MNSAYRIGLALLGLALLALAVWNGELAHDGYVNHDATNSLYIGEKVLHGARLYVDWRYYVMPSIVYLAAGVCLVAELLGLTPPTVLHVLVIATTALGVLVLYQARGSAPHATRVLTLAYLAIAVHAGSTPLQWADREHFFALLFVPYLVWRISEQPLSRAVLALCFGLGFVAMIKPHFLAGVGVAELFFLRESRGRRALWASIGAGALTPFALLALEPDSLRAFVDTVIPYHLSADYDLYDVPSSLFVAHAEHYRLLALGAGLLAASALAAARGLGPRRALAVPVVLALFFYLSIWHQRKFFPYHYLPFQAVSLVCLAGLAWRLVERWRPSTWRTLARGAVLALPLLLIAQGLAGLVRFARFTRPATVRVVDEALHGRGLVMLLTPSVEGHFFTYALKSDVEIMGPWSSNYTFPALLAIADEAERERAIRAYFAPLALRIRSERPALVLFSPFRQAMEHTTMHDVFVRQYRLFPLPGYRWLTRTPDGYVVYALR